MASYTFGPNTVDIEAPVEIARRPGHLWFPILQAFTSHEILCLGFTSEDMAQGEWPGSLYLSRDGGASWKPAGELDCCSHSSYGVAPYKRLLLPYELWPLTPGDRRNLVANGTILTCTPSGQVTSQRVPVQFLDFPVDLAIYHDTELSLLTNGNIIQLSDGSLLTSLYGRHDGEEKYRLFAVGSQDGGFTWHFLSHVAHWEDIPDGPEGPAESHIAQLNDGRLLCVFRVGHRREHPLHKCYSADRGHTWTKPEKMDGVWSVEPQLMRLENDLLVLSSGRTGMYLWVCADGVGNKWEQINLAAHHNAHVSDAAMAFHAEFVAGESMTKPYKSTSYTSMIRVSPDEVLIAYDRTANGWGGAPGPWGDYDAIFCIRVKATKR